LKDGIDRQARGNDIKEIGQQLEHAWFGNGGLARGGVANFGSISSLAKDGGNAHTFKGGKQ
jgi:hypothetical protein